jgi:hypothetical protein
LIDPIAAMSDSERKCDTRQLDLNRRIELPGELRLYHLSGPTETYILREWHAQPGEPVDERQLVATVETASFILEIEASDRGTMSEACFVEGEEIPGGALVARIFIPEANDS